tara:strand:+ start:2797 stop:3297 length:501 start_codon:yes stop_codon:yes gene_type:complete
MIRGTTNQNSTNYLKGAKMAKKKRNKKYNNYEHAIKIVKGLVMSWTVDDPLSDDRKVNSYRKVTHRNPIHKLMAVHIANDTLPLVQKRRLKYNVKIECEFKDDFGRQYFRAREMVIDGVLRMADDNYYAAVESIFEESNMNHYVTTHVIIEILGRGGIQENDFEAA